MLKMKRGFTILEAMISLLILSVSVLGLATLQGVFATQNSDRTLLNCLMDSASSALAQCQGGITPGNFRCGGTAVAIGGSVTSPGMCTPQPNTCNSVTASASAMNKTVSVVGRVCN